MKLLLSVLLALLIMGGIANAQRFCGPTPPKPPSPPGCKDLTPSCVCDSTGANCTWQWICIRN